MQQPSIGLQNRVSHQTAGSNALQRELEHINVCTCCFIRNYQYILAIKLRSFCSASNAANNIQRSS